MKENFFPTLGAVLEAVRKYLSQTASIIAEPEAFFDFFAMGGVAYGQTRSRAALLSQHRGKPCRTESYFAGSRKRCRGISLTVYRMESGTYEAVAYIS